MASNRKKKSPGEKPPRVTAGKPHRSDGHGSGAPTPGRLASGATMGDPREIAAARALYTMASAAVARAGLSSRMGKSYGGDRDLYEALGYPKDLEYKDLYARYRRQDIGRAVIDKPVRKSWSQLPVVTETDARERTVEKATAFEAGWEQLATRLNVWHYFSRVDRLSMIGEYAVLLIGYRDGGKLEAPVERASEVLFLMPYSQDSAKIKTYVTDPQDPNYGRPEMYEIAFKAPGGGAGTKQRVHASRVLHVAHDRLEDETLGIPALESIYNRLLDLDTVAGGSAEMYWRGALPGYGLLAKEGATFTQDDVGDESIEEEFEEYLHGLKRFFKIEGVDVKELKPQVANPTGHVDVTLTLISAATGIPKRILLGSERGELASSQDERTWADRSEERRDEHNEPVILRPFIDTMISRGVIPAPTTKIEGSDDRFVYRVEWPSLHERSDKDEAEVAVQITEALKKYADGADTYLSFELYLEKVLHWPKEDIRLAAMLSGEDTTDADGEDKRVPAGVSPGDDEEGFEDAD